MAAVVLLAQAGTARAAATLKAEYLFNNTLASDAGGAPALTVTDPQAASGFTTDTVFGNSQTVYNFQSSSSLPSMQAGLSFDNTGGLITDNDYSVQMIFKLTEGDGTWRRILDVQNRQSDSGFYFDPGNRLNIYPVVSSGPAYTSGTYVNVALTVAPDTTVDAYLNGVLELSTTTTVMDINNPQNLMNFFLDNVVGGGQGEWSPGDVAAIRLYNGVLTQDQVNALNNITTPVAVPEPGSLALLSSGLAGLAFIRRRRKA
jgi:hypothetical protein